MKGDTGWDSCKDKRNLKKLEAKHIALLEELIIRIDSAACANQDNSCHHYVALYKVYLGCLEIFGYDVDAYERKIENGINRH